jgi:hypothetical protein
MKKSVLLLVGGALVAAEDDCYAKCDSMDAKWTQLGDQQCNGDTGCFAGWTTGFAIACDAGCMMGADAVTPVAASITAAREHACQEGDTLKECISGFDKAVGFYIQSLSEEKDKAAADAAGATNAGDPMNPGGGGQSDAAAATDNAAAAEADEAPAADEPTEEPVEEKHADCFRACDRISVADAIHACDESADAKDKAETDACEIGFSSAQQTACDAYCMSGKRTLAGPADATMEAAMGIVCHMPAEAEKLACDGGFRAGVAIYAEHKALDSKAEQHEAVIGGKVALVKEAIKLAQASQAAAESLQADCGAAVAAIAITATDVSELVGEAKQAAAAAAAAVAAAAGGGTAEEIEAALAQPKEAASIASHAAASMAAAAAETKTLLSGRQEGVSSRLQALSASADEIAGTHVELQEEAEAAEATALQVKERTDRQVRVLTLRTEQEAAAVKSSAATDTDSLLASVTAEEKKDELALQTRHAAVDRALKSAQSEAGTFAARAVESTATLAGASKAVAAVRAANMPKALAEAVKAEAEAKTASDAMKRAHTDALRTVTAIVAEASGAKAAFEKAVAARAGRVATERGSVVEQALAKAQAMVASAQEKTANLQEDADRVASVTTRALAHAKAVAVDVLAVGVAKQASGKALEAAGVDLKAYGEAEAALRVEAAQAAAAKAQLEAQAVEVVGARVSAAKTKKYAIGGGAVLVVAGAAFMLLKPKKKADFHLG